MDLFVFSFFSQSIFVLLYFRLLPCVPRRIGLYMTFGTIRIGCLLVTFPLVSSFPHGHHAFAAAAASRQRTPARLRDVIFARQPYLVTSRFYFFWAQCFGEIVEKPFRETVILYIVVVTKE